MRGGAIAAQLQFNKKSEGGGGACKDLHTRSFRRVASDSSNRSHHDDIMKAADNARRSVGRTDVESRAGLLTVFDKHNMGEKGMLTREQVQAAMGDLQLHNTKSHVDSFMQAFDVDSTDGMISKQEFLKYSYVVRIQVPPLPSSDESVLFHCGNPKIYGLFIEKTARLRR